MIKIAAIIFLSLALAGCYKETPIQGKAVEFYGEPVPGAVITLHYWKNNSPGNIKTSTTTTGSDGAYNFEEKRKKNHTYELSAWERNHFEGGLSTGPDHYTFILSPFAFVKLRIIKAESDPTTLKVTVHSNEHNYVTSSYYLNRYSAFDSILSDLTNVAAYSVISIEWEVTDPSVPAGWQNPNKLSASADALKKHDTILYTIKY